MTPAIPLTLRGGLLRQLRTLVVPVGLAAHAAGASDAAALRCAALLARMSGARVVLVHVYSVPSDWYRREPAAAKSEALTREIEEVAENRLVRAARTLYYEGVPVEVEVIRRVDVAEGIVSAAQDAAADLIVMGTRGLVARHDEVRVTEHVIERASCPVLAVHRPEERMSSPSANSTPEGLRRILLVMGLEEHTASGGRLAVALAALHGSHLDVVIAPAPPRPSLGATEAEAIEGEGPSQHDWQLERLTQLLAPDAAENGQAAERLVQADVFVASEPEEAVRTAAAHPPDLLVLSGVIDRSLGTLVGRLVDEARCSVLVNAPRT